MRLHGKKLQNATNNSPNFLLQVRVEVETCEELRPMNTNQKGGMAASYASGGQYGFSDKVVDGITLTVNSVLLTLKSRAFIASFQVSSCMLFKAKLFQETIFFIIIFKVHIF